MSTDAMSRESTWGWGCAAGWGSNIWL